MAVESHMNSPAGVSTTGTPPGKPAAIASGLTPGKRRKSHGMRL
jgi:hypothetical protein